MRPRLADLIGVTWKWRGSKDRTGAEHDHFPKSIDGIRSAKQQHRAHSCDRLPPIRLPAGLFPSAATRAHSSASGGIAIASLIQCTSGRSAVATSINVSIKLGARTSLSVKLSDVMKRVSANQWWPRHIQGE